LRPCAQNRETFRHPDVLLDSLFHHLASKEGKDYATTNIFKLQYNGSHEQLYEEWVRLAILGA